MMTLVAGMLSFVGFAGLALSTARHHGDLFGRPPTRRTALGMRAAACLAFAASVAAAVGPSGTAVGIVLWFGLATMSVVAVALLLAYRAWRWPAGAVRR